MNFTVLNFKATYFNTDFRLDFKVETLNSIIHFVFRLTQLRYNRFLNGSSMNNKSFLMLS